MPPDKAKTTRFFRDNKQYILINSALLVIAVLLLKLIPVSKIEIPLTDSSYLSCIEEDSRISYKLPSMEETGYAVFKRIKFDLPFRLTGGVPQLVVTAKSHNYPFAYQFFCGKKFVGSIRIKPFHYRLHKPIIKKSSHFSGDRLAIILNHTKRAWDKPRLFLRRISLTPTAKNDIFTRDWDYILTFILASLPFILYGLFYIGKLWVKYTIAILSIAGFFMLNLLSIPLTLSLSTVIIPILIIWSLLIIALHLIKHIKLINITKEAIGAVTIIFLAGMMMWQTLTFHPAHYHPDLKTHTNWSLSAYGQSTGDFAAEYSFFQMSALLNTVAAFPYSPSFYIAVKLLSWTPGGVLFWTRFLPVTVTALLSVLIFLVALKLTGSTITAVTASCAYILSGITVLRILYFFYPALWGNFFIAFAILFLILRSDNYIERKNLLFFLPENIILFIGFVAYPSGPFCLGLFSLLLLVIWTINSNNRQVLVSNWIKIIVPPAVAANLLYYAWFIPDIVTRVIPRMKDISAGGSRLLEGESILSRLEGLLGLNVIFLAAAAGYTLFMLKKGKIIQKQVLGAWGFAWLFFFLARFIPSASSLFKFSKDELFLLPLLSISLGFLVGYLWQGVKSLKALAIFTGFLIAAGFLMKLCMVYHRLFIN